MRSSSSLRRPLVLAAAVLATLVASVAPAGAAVKAAVYYEPESTGNPTVAQLQSDLNYIFTRYTSDPSYYKVNGRPVIFAFADGADNCGMADRWKQANAGRFYVGLKVFNGYKLCASQPDAWHQYGPAAATDRQAGFSFSVSPGFWRADEATARLARDPARFRTNLQSAVASAEPWIHVTTLDEWGEGSSVEPAAEWQSASGNGTYLDILHAELAATTQITATYLYPWYPETKVGGRMSHWTPSLGNPYDSGSPAIIARQRDMLDYGNFDVALTSWWGQGTPTDSRFPAILSGFAGTTPTGDTTPPSQPGNFRNAGNVTDPLTQIRVAWSASTDNVGVTGYDVTRNGVLVDSRPATGLDHVSSGLTCGTSYTFTVRAKDAAGNRSTAASLTTSTAACTTPPPPTGAKVVLAAGDIQPASTGNPTNAVLDSNPHDNVITLGDDQYEAGSLANFNSFWAPNWGVHAPNSKLLPTPGNHESTKGGYCSYFTGKVAVPDPCPDPVSSNRQMYKATVGAWSVYSLDTGTSSGTGDFTAAEKTWLDQRLAADTNTCQMVVWHHPRYSSGEHGNSAGLADDWAMMMSRKVDLVLVGHDHDYERFAKMNSTGGLDATTGIRSFVVGTGGRGLRTLPGNVPGSQVKSVASLGLLKLTLRGTGYDWRFLPATGSFTDSGTDTCR